MNKILNFLIGLLMLVSLTNVVSVMSAVGPVKVSTDMPAVGTTQLSMPAPIAITVPVGFGSEGSNTMSRNLGTFEIIGSSLGSFTGIQNLSPGIYTIKFTPIAGFQFDSFRLVDGVQDYTGIGISVGGVSSDSVQTGSGSSTDMIAIGQTQTSVYKTIQVTGQGMVLAYAADVQAPTVSTSGGTYVSYGGPMYVTITATASDNDPMYPPLVKLTIDGTDYQMNLESPGVYSYSLSLAPGTHAYAVQATDAAGLVSNDSSTVTVSLVTIPDTQPPVIYVAGQTVAANSSNQATVTISASVTDNVAVGSVNLTINGNTYSMSQSGSTYSTTVTLAAGTYVATVNAVDTSGNPASANATITVTPYTAPSNGGNPGGSNTGGTSPSNGNNNVGDRILPTIQIIAPTSSVDAGSDHKATVLVKATATDNVGVAAVTLNVEGKSYSMTREGTSNVYTVSLSLDEGDHAVTAMVRDASGNFRAASKKITVNAYVAPTPVVEPTAPVVPVTPKPVETVAPVASSFWNIFKVVAINVGILALILIALLVFR